MYSNPFKSAYGRTNYKTICTKDSVKENLESKDYTAEVEARWLSSTKDSFQGKRIQEPSRKIEQDRERTNFVLGFNKTRYITTTGDYKGYRQGGCPVRVFPDNKTNIPDFRPQLTEIKTPGSSEYQHQYALGEEYERPKLQTLEERRLHTNDLRATHFQLGDFRQNSFSETQHSFVNSQENNNSAFQKCDNTETYKSRVFRDGDWNKLGRRLLSKSITQKDFDMPERYLPKQRPTSETEYQRSTHFNLRSLKSKNNSVYNKDYVQTSNYKCGRLYQPIAKPINSKLFPCSDHTNQFISTNSHTYGTKDEEFALKMRKERIKCLEETKKKHNSNAVPLRDFEKDAESIPQKLLSMTKSAFHGHHTTARSSEKQVSPIFNHLNGNFTNRNLSECQDSYGPLEQQAKEVRNDCLQRQQDNKATHFEFGNGNANKKSEHSAQYRVLMPLDPTVRAAGKSLPQTRVYSHIFSHIGEEKASLYQQSVMKGDYLGRNSVADGDEEFHKVLHRQPVTDTHFFHMDNEYKGKLKSTTQTHFVSPVV